MGHIHAPRGGEFFDKLEAKIEKEKSKIKDHHKKKEPAKEEE
jgi:ribosome-associated translation inhibitor RaiA